MFILFFFLVNVILSIGGLTGRYRDGTSPTSGGNYFLARVKHGCGMVGGGPAVAWYELYLLSGDW